MIPPPIAGIGFSTNFARDHTYGRLMLQNQDAWVDFTHRVLQLQQAYRNHSLQKRQMKQGVLSDCFWTHIFNNCDITPVDYQEVVPRMGAYGALLQKVERDTPNAFKYLWARYNYCKRDDRLAFWFTFWDDFWAENWNMRVLQQPAPNGGRHAHA